MRKVVRCVHDQILATTISKASSRLYSFTPGNKNKSPVWAWNEWDPLEEIVLGVPDMACCPTLLPEAKACISEDKYDFLLKHAGKYWKDVIDPEHYKLMLEEHKNFIKILNGEGVKVVHPEPIDFGKTDHTPNFSAHGVDCAMPRDFLLIVGNEMIESTMTWRSRYFEFMCYKKLIKDYWNRGAKWTAAPKPMCKESLFKKNYKADENSTAFFDEQTSILTEEEPVFDAADFIRCGYDIFAHVSQVSNNAGIEWVKRHLAPKGIRVHALNFVDPKPMHIDTTLFFPKPGLVITCPDRPCLQIGMFKKAGWDVVVAPYPNIPKDFPYYISSQWLSLNVVMLDEKRVLVEKDEIGIQKLFEKCGITPVKVPFKHCFGIGGGIHCWTSDVKRRGDLQNYFDWPQEILEGFATHH